MNQEFTDSLPREFVSNTLALCGDRGRAWIADLPRIIAELEQQWSIKAGSHFRNLSYNYVANVELPGGKTAVLKIGLPLEKPEIPAEAAYLRELEGDGAVKMFEYAPEYNALLLERIVPGASLRRVLRKDPAGAVEAAIGVLNRILRPVPHDTSALWELDEWFPGLESAEQTSFPAEFAAKALALYSELRQDTGNIHLLHGDLHHDNIIKANREPYLVIDPKGVIGNVGYDIAVFLNNHYWWLEDDTRRKGKVERAISEFAEAYDLTEQNIQKWAYCQMVLSWWWTFEDTPGITSDELGLSDIWDI